MTHQYFAALPAVLLAIPLGRMVNKRISGPAFMVCVHGGLMVVGVMLLLQSLGWMGG